MSDEARELATEIQRWIQSHNGSDVVLLDKTANTHLASMLNDALLAAEQRGLERAAQVCGKRAEKSNYRRVQSWLTGTAAAIRALKEQP